MTSAIDEFIEEACGVSIGDAAQALGLKFRARGNEHPQPCPLCGGRDGFAFNSQKNKWNCRHGGVGGSDAIGMAAHVHGLDIRRRDGFLEACSILTGRPVPEGGERESEEDRAARLDRVEQKRRENANAREEQERQAHDFREAERKKARGIYGRAEPLWKAGMMHGRFYLQRRGAGYTDDDWLRVAPSVTYWHGQDQNGQPHSLYAGAAMIAPFIGPDAEIIGCHITWIDLDRPPKYRPVLYGLTKEGEKAGIAPWAFGDAAPSAADVEVKLYEHLPAKKMRGSKKGGLIPLAGDPSARRWVGGEGIENGAAFGRWEKFRPDTFYFAAGDLGNLAGPADPKSRFAHPTLTVTDRKGRERPLMVAGPVPKPDQTPDDAMWVADHVDQLVLLGDPDSERIMTASAMARARKRLSRPGRLIPIVWGRHGKDFAEMMAEAGSEFEGAA
ncbi:P4 alpha zinc-binding domain-containing protein [Phyllobacterium phragmitis]|uniref:P4 alpha zinc-binding domain-containing protein n=1 Tax=Phyllobacterium phragmitis TaxID=2670329 RepID=A0A2S9IP74_9HYPH|nr:primase-helicase zinc-binding domain-containing protein [Phyllobacterium phragmitis]PRD42334.1 P4 alpha zinc-binding domain-containing protein [Phyllobacterium phragmitis]